MGLRGNSINSPAVHRVGGRHGARAALTLFAVAVLFVSVQTQARAQFSEYAVKAAFLVNFVQFVKWPPAALPNDGEPLVMGVLGDDPFDGVLDEAVKSTSIGGRKLIVRRSRRIEDLKGCQIVFVSKSEDARLGGILASLQGTSVLTVGETEQFAQNGGVINFTRQGDQVRFEINPSAAQRAQLEISSKLLKLARLVGP